MKLRMTKHWNGWHGGVRHELHPGVIVEGGLAEIVCATQPGWCEVLPEVLPEEPTAEPVIMVAPEPVIATISEPEIPAATIPEPEAAVEAELLVDKEAEQLRPFFAGPPADKMFGQPGDITPKAEALVALSFHDLARRAHQLGLANAWRMKKADLIRFLLERGV